MMALPPALLDLLHLRAGSAVDIVVDGDRLVVEARTKPRYTMDELLAASDYAAPPSPEDRDFIDAPTVGRELL